MVLIHPLPKPIDLLNTAIPVPRKIIENYPFKPIKAYG